MDISRDHFLFSVEKQINTYCKSLFRYTPFGYFDYERYYFDGLNINLGMVPELGYVVFKNDLIPTLAELHQNTSHYVYLSDVLLLPDSVMEPNKFIENIKIANEGFNVYHRLCLTFNTPEYVEVFAFGLTKPSKNMVEIFMNHINVLEKFCIYFRETSWDLLEESAKHRIRFDQTLEPVEFSDLNFKIDETYKDFFSDIKLQKYRLQTKNGNCFLTGREFECLLWSAKNKTAKQIGRLLSLSPRTVEDYLVKVKSKLNCTSKLELIDLACKNPIIKSYLD